MAEERDAARKRETLAGPSDGEGRDDGRGTGNLYRYREIEIFREQ